MRVGRGAAEPLRRRAPGALANGSPRGRERCAAASAAAAPWPNARIGRGVAGRWSVAAAPRAVDRPTRRASHEITRRSPTLGLVAASRRRRRGVAATPRAVDRPALAPITHTSRRTGTGTFLLQNEGDEEEDFETAAADDGEVDLYRDTALRYAGYANEVGEAFAPLVPAVVVPFSYPRPRRTRRNAVSTIFTSWPRRRRDPPLRHRTRNPRRYAVAITYVVADTIDKTRKVR